MKITPTELSDVLLIEPKVFGDARGFFFESWQSRRYSDLKTAFVQDNFSLSKKGILRGLHYQEPNPQGKLVSVLRGSVFDVAVDIRQGSPDFGKWVGFELNDSNHRQLYVPPGFAHGFCVLSEEALFHYKCTDYYSPEDEQCLLWNDPDIGVEWPISDPILSDKDRVGKKLGELVLPTFMQTPKAPHRPGLKGGL